MKKLLVLLPIFLMATMVFAKGPTNAGGIKPVEEYGIPFAPYNDNAAWYSGQLILPYTTLYLPDMGTTEIIEDGVTITVSEIPEAVYNPVTEEWEGTHLMWKANYNSKTYMLTYKFWLNGAGPVTITYDDGVNTWDEEATEFIFFQTIDEDGKWIISLQAYK